MGETVEIALAADGGYFDQLFVTATSMAAYCRAEDAVLRFNILDGGIAAADWEYLVHKVVELHPKSTFNKIPIDQKLFEKFPTWNGNRMAYARLLLPDALMDKNWVLYSDCDFLWLRDVAELWKERDERYAVLAVRDPGSWEKKEKEWFARNGLSLGDGEYFCSGMCLFNLAMFRTKDITRKTSDILTAHADVPYVDQTALNVSCADQVKLLDECWMRFTFELTPETHALPSVIHHAGEVPWKFVRKTQTLSDTMLLWHRFNAGIRDISVWRSLRKYFSPLEIVAHRSFAYLARFSISRRIVWVLCTLTGRRGAYHYFAIRGLRYDLPQFALGKYQIVGDYGDDFHAASKAQRDVTTILDGEGWKPFVVKRPTFCKGIVGKNFARLAWAVESRFLKAKLPESCTLFMQFPSESWSKNPALRVLSAAAKRKKRIRLVALFHDFASLRWKDESLANGQLARDEADLLALADVAIVHNEAMKAALVRRGIPAEKMITLEVFDYLTPCCQRVNRKLENAVVIAGNLNPDKAGYLDGLASISGVNWNLYGVQFNPARLNGDNVRFLGCHSPEELPGKLEGSFGLVWDGPSVEECRGALGNYLRINNPHKLSLYLASGLPVFIWSGAAEASFVKKHDVGVCVGSLSEIPSILSNLSEERYDQLVRNVVALSKLLREGHFLKAAIGRALCQGERHDEL